MWGSYKTKKMTVQFKIWWEWLWQCLHVCKCPKPLSKCKCWFNQNKKQNQRFLELWSNFHINAVIYTSIMQMTVVTQMKVSYLFYMKTSHLSYQHENKIMNYNLNVGYPHDGNQHECTHMMVTDVNVHGLEIDCKQCTEIYFVLYNPTYVFILSIKSYI